jgi:hypothetical protein
MLHWKFKDYRPKGVRCQIEEWYEEQDGDIQGEFDLALLVLAENEEWSETTDCVALAGDYLGLYELVIDVTLEDKFVAVRVIGIWRPDSPNFIMLVCAEKDTSNYVPLLKKALEYKEAWEQRREGEIYDHIF